jgi:hypothetical protein
MSRAKQVSPTHPACPRLAAVLVTAAFVGCSGRPGDPTGSPQPYARPEYAVLSDTGLYSDPGAQRLASGIERYQPNFALWSDGADKQRWISLPEGGWIDSSDMNHWRLPIGTRVWKEFSLDGVRLETRLIERYGTGADDYWMGTFVWQEDQTEAVFAEDGGRDLLGTAHDAPSQKDCGTCHGGEPGRVLGFSALQLARPEEPASVTDDSSGIGYDMPIAAPEAEEPVTLAGLSAHGWLSSPLQPDTHYGPPSDELAAAALGYLHANCGHCHNPWAAPWASTHMLLRLDVENVTAEESGVFQSIVGQSLDHFEAADFDLRVVPGEPEHSAIVARMEARKSRMQMPPLATEEADSSGIESVSRWVANLHE